MAAIDHDPGCIADFEVLAKPKLTKAAYDYIQTGANDCTTLQANIESFKRYRLSPRMLKDVSVVDLNTTIQGQAIDFPVGICPVAYGRLVHPDGESALAQACQAERTCYIQSMTSTSTIDEVAQAAATGIKWLQLFLFKNRTLTLDLVHTAERNGYTAIVLTVDVPVPGYRVADRRNNFKLPSHLRIPDIENIEEMKNEYMRLKAETGMDVMEFFAKYMFDSSLTWKDVKWLKQNTTLPIIIKGILTAEDAIEALNYGMSGIVVSNHGGRQLDSVMATIDALPEIIKAVDGRCEVYLDGGVRTGVDVLKALALGARAVFVGRPAMWSLAFNGNNGVCRMLQIFREELRIAMMLSGVTSVRDIPKDLLVKTCCCGEKL